MPQESPAFQSILTPLESFRKIGQLGTEVWSFSRTGKEENIQIKPCLAKAGVKGVFLLKYMGGFKEKLEEFI